MLVFSLHSDKDIVGCHEQVYVRCYCGGILRRRLAERKAVGACHPRESWVLQYLLFSSLNPSYPLLSTHKHAPNVALRSDVVHCKEVVVPLFTAETRNTLKSSHHNACERVRESHGCSIYSIKRCYLLYIPSCFLLQSVCRWNLTGMQLQTYTVVTCRSNEPTHGTIFHFWHN
jgi:hypothetical protein